MPGRSSGSPILFLVGAAVGAVAVVGTTLFGWEFGELADPVPVVLGVACAVLALISWLR